MNPKIIVGIVVVAFVVVLGILGTSGSILFDEMSGGNVVSPNELPNTALSLEIELEDISILEVNEKAATIEVKFKATNPNSKSVILQIIKYDLYENNIRVHVSQIGELPAGMMVESSNYFTVLSESSTNLKDIITIKNTGNTPELWNALSSNTPQWTIKGEASFNLSSITAGGENEITFEFHKNL